MSNKNIYLKRTWLEPSSVEVDSFIIARITREVWLDDKNSIQASLDLSDCHRRICWDFSVYNVPNKKATKKMLAKVKRAREAFDAFFDALEKEFRDES